MCATVERQAGVIDVYAWSPSITPLPPTTLNIPPRPAAKIASAKSERVYGVARFSDWISLEANQSVYPTESVVGPRQSKKVG